MSEELDLICGDIHDLRERMVKLEKWKEEFRKVNDIADQYKQRQEIMKKEIAELKERIEKLENDSFYWREKVSSKDSKPESDCINIRENVKFLTNDTYIVISRELLENIIEYISCEPRHKMADGDLKMLVELEKLKEVEKQ